MLTCRDCYAECEGQERSPDSPACDLYDGCEEEAAVPEANVNDVRDLYGAVAILAAEVAELQRKFNTIVAAVVKASGPEEER